MLTEEHPHLVLYVRPADRALVDIGAGLAAREVTARAENHIAGGGLCLGQPIKNLTESVAVAGNPTLHHRQLESQQ